MAGPTTTYVEWDQTPTDGRSGFKICRPISCRRRCRQSEGRRRRRRGATGTGRREFEDGGDERGDRHRNIRKRALRSEIKGISRSRKKKSGKLQSHQIRRRTAQRWRWRGMKANAAPHRSVAEKFFPTQPIRIPWTLSVKPTWRQRLAVYARHVRCCGLLHRQTPS